MEVGTNMKVTVMPVVINALGTVLKCQDHPDDITIENSWNKSAGVLKKTSFYWCECSMGEHNNADDNTAVGIKHQIVPWLSSNQLLLYTWTLFFLEATLHTVLYQMKQFYLIYYKYNISPFWPNVKRLFSMQKECGKTCLVFKKQVISKINLDWGRLT